MSRRRRRRRVGHKHGIEAGYERMTKMAEEAKEKGLTIFPKKHLGWSNWICLECGKIWRIPRDVSYPSLTCNCGSTDFVFEVTMKKVEELAKKVAKEVKPASE